jgi:CheY-like chemotaxis protein
VNPPDPSSSAVLLVDDEDCIRDAIGRVLARAGRHIIVSSGDLSQPHIAGFLQRTGTPALLKPYATGELLEALSQLGAPPA